MVASKVFRTSIRVALFILGLVLLGGISYYVANVSLKQNQQIASEAAAGVAQVSLEPKTSLITANTVLKLRVSTDKPVGFVAVELGFDPTLMSLSKELTLHTTQLSEVIMLSTMAEANASGLIRVVVAVKPQTVGAAPGGTFDLLTLSFSSKTTQPNKQSAVSIQTASTQLVDLTATPFALTLQPATVLFNTSATPTLVPTIVSTISPSITPTRAVNTPTPVPTIVRVPTATPIPTLMPSVTRIPTLPGIPTGTASPTILPTTVGLKRGDLDTNGVVDQRDVVLLLEAYLSPASVLPAADLNGDGRINALDYALILDLRFL